MGPYFGATVFRRSGPHLNLETVFPRYGDSRVKDKTVFNMGIPILVRRHLYIETASQVFIH